MYDEWNWSPREPWHQTSFQPSHHHQSFVSGYTGPISNVNWHEPQLTALNGFSGMSGMGENHVHYPNMDDLHMQAGLNQLGHMQQPAPATPVSSGILVEGENKTPFQDVNCMPGQADCIELGNMQEPTPAIPCDISCIRGTGGAQTLHPYMHAFTGQAVFNSNGNWLAPVSAIPGDFLGTHRMGGNQILLPDLNMLPMQPGFNSNGNWPEPLLMATEDLSCTVGMGGNQALFPEMNTPPMPAVNIPNRNLHIPEPVEPGEFSDISGTEDTHSLQTGVRVVSGGVVSYADELWGMAVAMEPGGYEAFLGEEYPDLIDLTSLGSFQESVTTAPSNPSGMAGMGDHHAFKRDPDTFSERLDLSTVEAFQQPETTSAINQFSLLRTGQHQVSHHDQETFSEQLIVTEREDCEVVLLNTEDFEDTQPATPINTRSLFGSEEVEMLDPDLKALSMQGNTLIEYGIPDVLLDI
jgi:hypothetical protein